MFFEDWWKKKRKPRDILQSHGKPFVVRGVDGDTSNSDTQTTLFSVPKPDIVMSEMSTSAIPPFDTFNPTTDGVHSSMRPIIMLAQCFSMLPVSGNNFAEASHLKFTWRSPKIVYCAISFLGALTLSTFNVIRLLRTGLDSKKATSLFFYVTTLVASVLFLRLAKQWPYLMLTWEKLERKLAVRHRKVSKNSLAVKFKLMTAVVMVFASFEHTLSVLSGYASAVECANLRGTGDILGTYFQSQFPQVFSILSYSLWKGILVDAVNVLSTFSWNFVDLFLILLSIALTDQFRQLNSRLSSIRSKAMPEWWWAEARDDYNLLANLTRKVDAHVSDIVFLSFATDLYFICIQLLYSFNPMRDIIQKVYFCFSFGFLLARTTAVSLYAASIHDESLLPAPILYSVSGSSYSTEVMRFLTQVTTDKIGLTGKKFFAVTRSLVLTVAGTIVTYELVLVQFNSVQPTESSNITNVCEVK